MTRTITLRASVESGGARCKDEEGGLGCGWAAAAYPTLP